MDYKIIDLPKIAIIGKEGLCTKEKIQNLPQEIEQYLAKYPEKIAKLYEDIRNILLSIEGISVDEKMWAKLPSYYCGEKFVRIIPFKDHINIEASGLILNSNELSEYKFTPKGMLQIKAGQKINSEILKKAFSETLK